MDRLTDRTEHDLNRLTGPLNIKIKQTKFPLHTQGAWGKCAGQLLFDHLCRAGAVISLKCWSIALALGDWGQSLGNVFHFVPTEQGCCYRV